MNKSYTIDGSRDALWMATATGPPPTTPLDGDQRFDVAIIGAGLTALNAALHLARHGVSVGVLEAAGLGFGASGRSGGQVNLGLNLSPSQLIEKFGPAQGERLIDTVINTPDHVFSLIKEHALQCDPVQNGWVQGAVHSRQLPLQSALADEYARYGCALEVLNKDDLTQRTGTNRYQGGLFVPMAGSLQPLSYTRELARAAIAHGAAIYTQTPVTGLHKNDTGWLLKTATGTVGCEHVLVCTNGYTGNLVSGLAQRLVPVRSILIASEPLSDNLRKTVLPDQVTFVDKRNLILYFRYDRDGRICVGDHGPMRDEFRLEDYTSLKRRVLDVFPQLESTRWDYHWGGRVAMTKSTLPFLYEIAPGLTAGMGYNGRGVGMGTMMGKILAEHILHPTDQAGAFPVTEPKKFALHKFHSAGVTMAVKWYALQDHLASL
ncbi:hypothetical protein AB833_23560 [Chromatiales bacterium (ex Bugula neritina AB1)]|nr:hypothetical protein AB833_23560 [Chromatiales bacterium (ex Bugula neritina AB1)]